jgi:hypothetical protein
MIVHKVTIGLQRPNYIVHAPFDYNSYSVRFLNDLVGFIAEIPSIFMFQGHRGSRKLNLFWDVFLSLQ